jgi:hypothetical protein
MIILGGVSDKVQVVTSAAVPVDVHASYADYAGVLATPGRQNTAIVAATTTDVVGSPAAATTRNVKTLYIKNKHASLTVDVTVIHTDGVTPVTMEKVTLLAGEALSFVEGEGFRHLRKNGSAYVRDMFAATRIADPSGSGTDLTIAAAIAALPASGGTIFIKGAHDVAATLVLSNKNIVFRGEGCGSARINFSGVGALFSQANSNREFSIEHILLDGLSTAATQKVVDVSGSGVEVYISNVMIVGFHDDIKDSGVGNEFILTHTEIIVPAFGTFDQKIYDGVASGEMVWNYVNVTFTEASDRFAFGGTDAVVGTPKWIVNHSYIGAPPPAISTFDIGQLIVTQFRVDRVVFFINGAYSNITQLEAIDAKLNPDADNCTLAASSFAYVSGGVDPYIEPTGQELIVDGCNFDGATVENNAILAASVRMAVTGCTFDGFSSDAIRLGTGMSGTVEGCVFLNTAVPVRELFTNADLTYDGNKGFGGSIIIGSTSIVNGRNTRAITTTPVTLDETHRTVLVNATVVARVINLPTAASARYRVYTIKKVDASVNTVTVDGSGAETIDGVATVVLTSQWESVTVQSDGTAWFRID